MTLEEWFDWALPTSMQGSPMASDLAIAMRESGWRVVKLAGAKVGHGVDHSSGKPVALYHRSTSVFHVTEELT